MIENQRYKTTLFIIVTCALLVVLNACNRFKGDDDNGVDIIGQINVFEGSAIDSDVNDPRSPYQANDSAQSAQPVTNPVTLGGYVNQPQTGPAGRSFEAGDTDDYFSTTLLQDQQITLYAGNRDETATLDFYLYNQAGDSLIDSASGITSRQSFTVPASGAYIIRVHAASGASNYNLTIGFGGTSLAAASVATDHKLQERYDFVPGEVIVRFKETSATGQPPAAFATAGTAGLEHKAGAAGREMLFSIADRQVTFQALGIQQSLPVTNKVLQQKRDTLEVIKALRQRPDVEFVSLNYIVRPAQIPDDTYYGRQWHYPLINLPQAWDITTGTSDIVVAVVDTGVLLDHPDLQGQLLAGYDFVVNRNGQDSERDNEPGIDANPNDPGNSATGGSSFHGTHVAGTVAAATNNGSAVAGVAWNVKIMPIRALGATEGTIYDIGQAVRYAAGLANDSGTVPAQVADIINLSLGAIIAPADVAALREPFDLARQAGAIVIAAAGNDSDNVNFFPAMLDGVISVNAVNIRKQLASYSNFGPTIDLSAPGGDSGDINGDGFFDGVYSLGADDSGPTIIYGTAFAAGTSMAAPHVSGVAALMKSVFPGLTPDLFDRFLKTESMTEDLGIVGPDDLFGYGLIDALKSVNAAVAGAGGVIPVLDPIAIVSPTSLKLTPQRTEIEITIRNGGDGVVNVLDISNDSTGWLVVTPVADQVDPQGLGVYQVSIDNSNVPPGSTTLAAHITVTTDVNNLQIPVIAQLQIIPFADNAGVQYVLLLNSDRVSQYEVHAEAAQGHYLFRFNNIPRGRYYLVTGSDINHDDVICDPGESCGEFPTLDHPRMIEISGASVSLVTDTNATAGSENSGNVTTTIAGPEFDTGYHVAVPQSGAIQRLSLDH